MRLHIDIETYSDVDLIDAGVYRYVEGAEFEILLFAYSYNDGEVRVVDLAQGEKLPQGVKNDLLDSNIEKHAYNAQFERLCINRHFGINIPTNQWHCSMVHGLMAGLPGGLANVALALDLEEQKDRLGTLLINYFSKACRPTKANGQRTRNLPHHDPERWDLFKKYCIQDVVVEKAIYNCIKDYSITEFERDLYLLDQKINDYGIKIDTALVSEIIRYHDDLTEKKIQRAKDITGLSNPNSRAQVLKWLETRNFEMANLQKATVEDVLSRYIEDMEVREVLEIRQDTSMSSISKYTKMISVASSVDSRARGLLQFYGARTGRFAGRLIQVQNLPRTYLKETTELRNIIKKGEVELLELVYDSTSDVLSQLIRTALIAKEDMSFIISDYSAIEARVLSWLAEEQWQIDVFNGDGKIYEATYAEMFNVDIKDVDREKRSIGKVAALALGYQGSVGALKQMGALNIGLEEHELQGLVNTWRNANSKITQFWNDVETSAIKAIYSKKKVKLRNLSFYMIGGHLHIELPSKRTLVYRNARVVKGTFNRENVEFDGFIGASRKWGRERTYGGKLVENITQAIARDALAVALTRLDNFGLNIASHVHDEVVVEGLITDLMTVQEFMSKPIDWAPGLWLPVEAFTRDYFM